MRAFLAGLSVFHGLLALGGAALLGRAYAERDWTGFALALVLLLFNGVLCAVRAEEARA